MRVFLGLLLSLAVSAAAAQGCGPSNPNCIVPTAPPGTSNKQAASTEFVQNAVPLDAVTALTGDVTATGPGSATATIAAGAVTGTKIAAGTVANSNLTNMAGLTMKANATGSSAAPQDVSATSWFDAAYCNTIGWVIVRFTSAWTCSKFIAANPVWWGADPAGVSDSASALNSALAASGVVEFPAGKFKFLSAISYSIPTGINSVTLKGQGQDVTILTWPNAAGGMTFTYASINSSVHFRDLSLTTGTTNGGTAVKLNLTTSVANPAVFAPSDFYRVTFRGDDGYALTDYWTTAIAVQNVSNVNFDAISIWGPVSSPTGNGITLVGLPASSTFGVNYNISKSMLIDLAVGINYGNFVQGVTVDQTTFAGSVSGIITAGSLTGLAQLSVTNSEFDTTGTTNGIAISTNSRIDGVQLTNNLFLVNGTTPVGVNLPASSFTTIQGNIFWNSGAAAANAIGVNIPGVPTINCQIQGNIFRGFSGAGAIAANIGGGNCTLASNSFSSNTTNIALGGSGNVVLNNSGYNPVGVTNNTMGASPFTYTAGPTWETHYVRSTGTISSITIGGQTIATASLSADPIVIDLGPGEGYVTTWGVTAPTYVRSIH